MIIILWSNFSHTQTDPTLSVGLESLTYGKGTIDVELLTEIILEKQQELKQEALKRFMFNLFPEGNYTTKFYMQNALHILLNEQNPEVIKKELLEILTNYSLALGFTAAYREIHPEYLEQVSNTISKVENLSENYLNEFDDYLNSKKGKLWFISRTIEKLKLKAKGLRLKLDNSIKSTDIVDFVRAKYEMREFIIKNPKYSKDYLLNDLIVEMKLNDFDEEKEKKKLDDLKSKLKKIAKENEESKKAKKQIDSLEKQIDIYNAIINKNTLKVYSYYLNEYVIIKDSTSFADVKKWISNIYEKTKNNQLKIYVKDTLNIEKLTNNLSDSIKKNIVTINNHFLIDFSKEASQNSNINYQLINSLTDKKLNTFINVLENTKNKEDDSEKLYDTLKSKIKQYKGFSDFLIKLNELKEVSYPKEELFKLFEIFESKLNEEKELVEKLKKLNDRINDKSIRKGINNSELIEIQQTKSSIPFGLLLDVVSTALCNNKELKNKGFFKQRINYADGRAFNNSNPEVQIEIKLLEEHISKTIKDYVSNYDIIKALAKNVKDLKGEDVFDELKEKFIDDFKKSYDSLTINEVKELLFNGLDEKNKSEITSLINNLGNQEEISKYLDKEVKYLLEKCKTTIENYDLYSEEKFKSNFSLIKSESHVIAQKFEKLDSIKTFFTNLDSISKTILNESLMIQNPIENELQDIKDGFMEINYAATKEEYKKLEKLNDITAVVKIKKWLDEIKEQQQNNKEELNKRITKFKNRILKELLNDVTNPSKINKKNANKLLVLFLENFKYELSNKPIKINDKDSVTARQIAIFSKELYKNIDKLISKERISISDIIYLQNIIIPEIIELRVLSSESTVRLLEWQEKINHILPFLNIKAIEQITNQELSSEQIEKITELLEFIGNLDNLDKAETFEHIINLFRDGNDEVNKHLKDGEFKNLYNLFSNAIKKYTLVNSKEQYIEVDVASFLVELESYYDKNNTANWEFYLGIGLSQNFFFDDVTLSGDSDPARSVGFASEKLGVKYKILDFKRASDYTNVVPNDIYLSNRSPFINEWYANLYGSGLLYSLANSTTNENFDFAHVGLGTGIRFYNALDFSLNIGFPLGEKSKPIRQAFVGFGFDIPLSEYLTRSKRKKSKKKKD